MNLNPTSNLSQNNRPFSISRSLLTNADNVRYIYKGHIRLAEKFPAYKNWMVKKSEIKKRAGELTFIIKNKGVWSINQNKLEKAQLITKTNIQGQSLNDLLRLQKYRTKGWK